MDYLLEEVLSQQSERVQTFLLRTAILDRFCSPLCDAVVHDPSASGRETLDYLERANLFLVPLDNERKWYRYHHLFAELLRQGSFSAAADLAHVHNLSLSQTRVHLARRDPSAALAVLEPWRRQVETKDWKDERLKVLALQAVTLQASGEQEKAVQALRDVLLLAEPAGFIRLFVDEGLPMAHLLSKASASGIMPEYIGKVLAAFEAERHRGAETFSRPLLEPLSHRELEVLHLMAQGLSNQEIGERLVLALDTVKGHNRSIFGKLQVQRRTEAIARARELGLL